MSAVRLSCTRSTILAVRECTARGCAGLSGAASIASWSTAPTASGLRRACAAHSAVPLTRRRAQLASPAARRRKALIGFRGAGHRLRDQASDQGPEQRLPAAPGVVHELEEAEVGGQLLLRDAPVRPQPGTQQRPEAFGRVDVHLAEPVAVLVAGVLAPGVADGLVPVDPVLQPGVDAVLVGVDEGALRDGRLDHRPDRPLPDVGEHAHDPLPPGREQAEDRRLVLGERAATGGASQPPTSAGTPLLATAAGLPLWPATT